MVLTSGWRFCSFELIGLDSSVTCSIESSEISGNGSAAVGGDCSAISSGGESILEDLDYSQSKI